MAPKCATPSLKNGLECGNRGIALELLTHMHFQLTARNGSQQAASGLAVTTSSRNDSGNRSQSRRPGGDKKLPLD
jgi:hypothetical protein